MLDPTSLAFLAMTAYVLLQQAKGDHLMPIGDRARVLDLNGARTVMEWHARSAGGRIHGSPLEVIASAYCLGIDISIYRQRELRDRVLDELVLCFTARGFVPQLQLPLSERPTINVLHREPHFTALSPRRSGDPLLLAVSRGGETSGAWFYCYDITCFLAHAILMLPRVLPFFPSARPFTICDPFLHSVLTCSPSSLLADPALQGGPRLACLGFRKMP
jgi:hypothetical protein